MCVETWLTLVAAHTDIQEFGVRQQRPNSICLKQYEALCLLCASLLCRDAGAEPDSASEGVDTAVGEASQIAKTGSTIKTQRKPDDPKVCMQGL